MSPEFDYKLSPWTRIRNMRSDVRVRRINRETLRSKLAQALFVNVPRLRMKDGTVRAPLSLRGSK